MSIETVKKEIASWEIRYGQIAIYGRTYDSARKLFNDYIGITFNLDTFTGRFSNRHFLDTGRSLRLACAPFFSQLNEGDVIFLQPYDKETIKITKDEPTESVAETEDSFPTDINPDITKLLVDLAKENKKLREENEELIKYKDRIEKYKNLDYIFEDEQFMEDWLERNIHKVLPNLEIIDRQPIITWNELFMRNRPDFFCLDKTTREFVVVENKVRGRFRTIETQFLTYTAWVRRNIDNINEKYRDKNLRATEKFKFVIITDSIDERLEAICEDNRITL